MFTKGLNIVLTILIVLAVLTSIAALFFSEPRAELALAQGGRDGETSGKIKYTDVIQGAAQVDQTQGLSGASTPGGWETGGIGPKSDGSGVEVIPIAAFRHNGDNAEDWFNSFNGGYIRNRSGNTVCFMAPVYLPDGATLGNIEISLLDDSAAGAISFVDFRRVNLSTGAVNLLAGGGLPFLDSPTAIRLVNGGASGGTVSNAYAYYYSLCFAANTGLEVLFYGGRVNYTPPP